MRSTLSNSASNAAGRGRDMLSPTSYEGTYPDNGHPKDGGSVGPSEPYSGDSYDDGSSLSGAPPRTAFLSRDEVSEDSRLLQQILKESEEEIAASVADRANSGDFRNGGGSVRNGGAMTKVVSTGGGGGDNEYGGAYSGLDGYDYDRDANVRSLDVDQIIESMELEAGEDDDIGGPRSSWLGPPFSSATAAASGGAALLTSPPSMAPRRRSLTTDGNSTGRNDAIPSAAPSPRSRDRGGSVSASAKDTEPMAADEVAMVGGVNAVAGRTSRDSGDLSALEHENSSPDIGLPRDRRKRVGGVSSRGDAKSVYGAGEWGLTKPLRKAEAAEQRLLRGGNRDIISPLQVRVVRLMRAGGDWCSGCSCIDMFPWQM